MARTWHELTTEELLIVEDLSNLSWNAGKIPVVNVTEDWYDFQAWSWDMTKSVYDPQNINDDAFDRANHTWTQALSTITEANSIAFICDNQFAVTDYTFDWTERRNSAYLVTTASSRTINIDADLFSAWYEVTLCKWTNNTNTVTLDAQSGNNINWSQTFVLTQYNEVVTLVKDWANTWKIKSHYYPTSVLAPIDSPVFTTKIQTPTIELWHATDTSITRVSAWVIAVEWIPAIIAGSTTVWQVPTITGSNTYSWQTPSTWGGFWTAMPWTPTRTWNTTFTVTWDVTAYVAKWMVIKWTESSAIKCAFVSIPSTYSAPNTTITIVWDTMASIDASSLKYAMLWLDREDFNIAWDIWASGTDIARAYCAPYPMRVLWADLDVWTAGTTGNTTVDINKWGTTMFTTKPTLATTVWASPLPFTADSGTSLALNNKVTIDIDAFQWTPAKDLYVHLYLFPTRYLSLA